MNTGNLNGHELITLDLATRLLSEATSIEQILAVRDRAVAWRQFAETVMRSLQLQNEAAEIRLRAERKAGIYLRDLKLRGGNRRSNSLLESLNLEELQIDRNESSRWQQLADMSEQVFERYFQVFRSSNREITRASLIRYSRLQNGTVPNEQAGRDGDGEFSGVLRALRELIASQKLFSCICVYPPWPKVRRIGRDIECRQRLLRFRSALERLPIGELAASNAHVHLATTSERLEDAMHVLHAWKARYRTVLVCSRQPFEHGPYWRSAQDFMLLGTRGNAAFRCRTLLSLIEMTRLPFAITAQPLRELMEQASTGPFLELFGSSACPGWTVITANGKCQVGG